MSGFPEPFVKGIHKFQNRWQEDYVDRLIREDLRDLTRIHELENIATLMGLLSHRVGSPLSLNSLKEDLEVSHTAIRNYLKALCLCYINFLILPYAKKMQRAVKKESKCYFFDYTRVPDLSLRFENFVALEIYSLIHLWNDSGWGKFELSFVRMRDKKETDFLILKNSQPWLLLEAKLSELKVEPHHLNHALLLGKIPYVQIIYQSSICKILTPKTYVVSASRFFG